MPKTKAKELARPAKRREKAPAESKDPLTAKQWAFVRAYLSDACGNGTDAARIAGLGTTYKEWSNQASYILSLSHVQKTIRKAIENTSLSAGMTLTRLSQFVGATISDFLALDAKGRILKDDFGRPQFDLDKASRLNKLYLIDEIIIEADGRVRLKLPNRLEAARILAKYHGLLVERVEVGVVTDDMSIRQSILDKLMSTAKTMADGDRALLAGLIAPPALPAPAIQAESATQQEGGDGAE